MKSMRALLPVAGLLLVSSIYSSCNQPVAHDKIATASKDSATATPDSTVLEGTKSVQPVETFTVAAISSPEDAVKRYDEVLMSFKELAVVVKAAAKINTTTVPYEYMEKLEKLKKNADLAMNYFARNRSKFSKEQTKHILDDTDKLVQSMDEILPKVK